MSELIKRLRDDALDGYASATGAGFRPHLSEVAADALEGKDSLIAEMAEAIFKVTEEWYEGEDGDDILAANAKTLRDLYSKAIKTQDQSEGGVDE